jgi:hypothetical protein
VICPHSRSTTVGLDILQQAACVVLPAVLPGTVGRHQADCPAPDRQLVPGSVLPQEAVPGGAQPTQRCAVGVLRSRHTNSGAVCNPPGSRAAPGRWHSRGRTTYWQPCQRAAAGTSLLRQRQGCQSIETAVDQQAQLLVCTAKCLVKISAA